MQVALRWGPLEGVATGGQERAYPEDKAKVLCLAPKDVLQPPVPARDFWCSAMPHPVPPCMTPTDRGHTRGTFRT